MKFFYQTKVLEAGIDEAGRGALMGPVFAAAVILPPDFHDERIKDSKKLSPKRREVLRKNIEENAIAYNVASVDIEDIDLFNVHQATMMAMHKALDGLKPQPKFVLVDGAYFVPWKNVGYTCVIKGDDKLSAIAAASILAKTYRDEYVMRLGEEFPHYKWDINKGYCTKEHIELLAEHGISPYHRKSFKPVKKYLEHV